MQRTEETATPLVSPSPDVLRAAFRELHGRRLHGFALLLTLGDRAGAASLASAALADGMERLGELRHPERAAAWLRARVVDRARALRRAQPPARASVSILDELGADEALVAGLAALDRLERAALIAAEIERLDRRDVAGMVGRDVRGLDRLLDRARRRFVAAHALATPPDATGGPLSARVNEIAQRAMA